MPTPISSSYPIPNPSPSSASSPTLPGSPTLPVQTTSADATVAVNRTVRNATQATSNLGVGMWMTPFHFLGWRPHNEPGIGVNYVPGSWPVYEGDGTAASPGPIVTQARQRLAECSSWGIINWMGASNSLGSVWTDPTNDCPVSDTGTYPYYAYSASSGIPFVSGGGFYNASAYTGLNTSPINPWAMLDQRIMLARTLYPDSQIVICLRAAPPWMSAVWQASWNPNDTPTNQIASNGALIGAISTITNPNQASGGGPPLAMNVLASPTGSFVSRAPWGGYVVSNMSAGATSGTLAVQNFSYTLGQLSNGTVVTFDYGLPTEENVTLTTIVPASGAFTCPATTQPHLANSMVIMSAGTRIIPSFWGGNSATSGQAANGYAPPVGQVWDFNYCFARLARRVAERYPFIQWYIPYAEPNSGGTPDGAWAQTSSFYWCDSTAWTQPTTPFGSGDSRKSGMLYTAFYNRCYNALKSITGRTTPLNVGGPYNALAAFGTLQGYDSDMLKNFFLNCAGLDMIVNDSVNANDSGSGTDPSTGLANSANWLSIYTASSGNGIVSLATSYPKATGKPCWHAEFYFDSDLVHLPSWLTHRAQGCASATGLYYLLLGGVYVTGRWQCIGDRAYSSTFRDSSYGGLSDQQSVISDSYPAAGLTAQHLGQPFPNYHACRMFNTYFPAGTPIYTTTVTDGSASSGKTILALASGTYTLLINQYPAPKTVGVSVNGGATTYVTIDPYGIAIV